MWTVKKSVVVNFANFTGKHLCQSLFLNKVTGLSPATLLKRTDSGPSAFLWILRNFKEHLPATASSNGGMNCFPLVEKYSTRYIIGKIWEFQIYIVFVNRAVKHFLDVRTLSYTCLVLPQFEMTVVLNDLIHIKKPNTLLKRNYLIQFGISDSPKLNHSYPLK